MIINYALIKGLSMDINLKCYLINLFFFFFVARTHLDMHLHIRFVLNRLPGGADGCGVNIWPCAPLVDAADRPKVRPDALTWDDASTGQMAQCVFVDVGIVTPLLNEWIRDVRPLKGVTVKARDSGWGVCVLLLTLRRHKACATISHRGALLSNRQWEGSMSFWSELSEADKHL